MNCYAQTAIARMLANCDGESKIFHDSRLQSSILLRTPVQLSHAPALAGVDGQRAADVYAAALPDPRVQALDAQRAVLEEDGPAEAVHRRPQERAVDGGPPHVRGAGHLRQMWGMSIRSISTRAPSIVHT